MGALARVNTSDTIAAVASGVGGAISIVRIAGPEALRVGNALWHGTAPLSRVRARRMCYGKLGGEPVLAVYMPGPQSYTGDDVMELHLHGSPLAVNAALQRCCTEGARLAEPGEFTFRAFVNGKMELTQAEAVCDLIHARSEGARHLAERQLAGKLGDCIHRIRTSLLDVLAECESHLDFPDEELDWDASPGTPVRAAETELRGLLDTASAAQLWRNGVNVVIAGRPNAGKSSLLNALLGFDRAIVSAIPGTTRDTLEELLNIDGIPVRLTDTAGLRAADDEIEVMGIERSRRSQQTAELIFWVLDASDDADTAAECAEFHSAPPEKTIAVWNKMDRCSNKEALPPLPAAMVHISARTGDGLGALRSAFRQRIWGDASPREPEIGINSRHRAHLQTVLETLLPVAPLLEECAWELAAIHLRCAAAELGRITGETADPDILENIFSRFCIGK